MNQKRNAGFTLIELMIVVAIISILSAIALPQYVNFLSRAKRTEAIFALSGAHKAQMSYYADVDHFLHVCDDNQAFPFPSWCMPSTSNEFDRQQSLGLDRSGTTPHQYQISWVFESGDQSYQMHLMADLDGDPFIDELEIGINPFATANCSSAGYSDGIPFLYTDDITNSPPAC